MKNLLHDISRLIHFLFMPAFECENDHSYDWDRIHWLAIWRSFVLLFLTPSDCRILFPGNNGEILFDYRYKEGAKKRYVFIVSVYKDGYDFILVDIDKPGAVMELDKQPFGYNKVAWLITETYEQYVRGDNNVRTRHAVDD